VYYLIEREYPPAYRHGERILDRLLGSASLPAMFNLPGETEPSRMIFMDTETTGLAGGAGTLAFLVGTGSFGKNGFLLRQYFLPDPAGEAAMLEDVLTEMEAGAALVTFNGRAFDVPILQARATLRLRRFDALKGTAHLDLLAHARRLWRRKLDSCSLGSLEHEMLGVRRSYEDVPSSLIPFLYREYLQTGDPQPMEGVLYHNAQDILSMATLAADILDRYLLPPAEIPDPLEALSLAFSFRREGQTDPAEDAFRASLRGTLPAAERAHALEGLAALLKQKRTTREAAAFWEEWHTLAPEDPRPCVELAKYYEWREKDAARALAWAEQALSAAQEMPLPVQRDAKRAAEHRIKRLKRKLNL
jgi:uncharacterized protein YprB with RNaseH-like and TPR domain